MPGPVKRSESTGRSTVPPRGRRGGGEDRIWKRLTLLGNAAFAGGRLADAELLYDSALAEARRLFAAAAAGESVRGCEPAPLLVASTANAAENWLRLDKGECASDAMIQLCRTLCQTIEADAVPFAFREQCFTHLRMATLDLLTILPRAGCSEEAGGMEAAEAKATALRFAEKFTPKH